MLDEQISAESTEMKHSRSAVGNTTNFTTYPLVVHFLLKNHAANEVIAKKEFDITRFAEPSGMQPSQYAEELATRTLRRGGVFEQYTLTERFIEGLDAPIRHSMCEYWGGMKRANLHDLVVHTTSLLRMHGIDITSRRTNPSTTKQQT